MRPSAKQQSIFVIYANRLRLIDLLPWYCDLQGRKCVTRTVNQEACGSN